MIGVAAPAFDNMGICGYGSRRGGRDDGECADSIFKQPILLPSPDAPLRVAGRGRGVFASHTASEFAEAPPTPDPSPQRARARRGWEGRSRRGSAISPRRAPE